MGAADMQQCFSVSTVRSAMAASNGDTYGLGVRDATGGEVWAMTIEPVVQIAAQLRTDYTSAPSDTATHDIMGIRDFWARVEIEWDQSGSDEQIRFSYSTDGVHFFSLHDYTDAISGDAEVGLFMVNKTLADMRGFIYSWHEENVTF